MNEHMQQLEMVLTKLAAKLNEFKGQLAANDEKWRTVKSIGWRTSTNSMPS